MQKHTINTTGPVFAYSTPDREAEGGQKKGVVALAFGLMLLPTAPVLSLLLVLKYGRRLLLP